MKNILIALLLVMGLAFAGAPVFNSATPADIDSANVVSTPLRVQYNLTGTGDNSTALIWYKVNSSLYDYWEVTNGSAILNNWENKSVSSNGSTTVNYTLDDNDVYPHTENIESELYRTQALNSTTLSNANQYYATEQLNVSNTTAYGFYEQDFNSTTATAVRTYACNSSYAFSNDPSTNANCVQLASTVANGAANHCHPNPNGGQNYSCHQVMAFPVNTTTGRYDGTTLKVTPKMFFIIRGNAGATINVKQMSILARVGATKTSTNSGNTWTNQTYTADGHLHQFELNASYWEYACANLTLNCSATRQDLLGLAGLPPSAPSITSPFSGSNLSNSLINISYTASASPNGYAITYYNISLYDMNGVFVQAIQANNSLNLSYMWNVSTLKYGQYNIRVYAYDNMSQSSFSRSDLLFFGPMLPLNCSGSAKALNAHNTGYVLNDTCTVNGAVAAITIGGTNTTIDCNGFSIYGNNSTGSKGIYISQNYSTVRNCNISNFEYNINVDNYARYALIYNTTSLAIGNTSRGIYLSNGVQFTTIQNVTALAINTSTSTFAVYYYLAYNTTMIDTVLSDPGYWAIFLNGASENNFTNVTSTSNTNTPFYIYGASNRNVLTGCNISSTSGSALVIQANSVSNLITDSTIRSSTGAGIYFSAGGNNNNTISNSQIYGRATTVGNGVIYLAVNASNNTFANNTINGNNGSYVIVTFAGGNNYNKFINNTISNVTTSMVYIEAASSGNQFYWNNFTSTLGKFVTDLNGSNYYNTSTEGNIWGSSADGHFIYGNASSSTFPSYYIGNRGAVPYSNGTSAGKFTCQFAGCQDNFPLTTLLMMNSSACPGSITTSRTLNQSISAGAGTCITIGAANVVLDCAGYTMIGNNTIGSIGVAGNQANTTIKNCNIQGVEVPIKIYGSLAVGNTGPTAIKDSNLTVLLPWYSGAAFYIGTNASNALIDHINATAYAPFQQANGFAGYVGDGTSNVTIKNSYFMSANSTVVYFYANISGSQIINSTMVSMGAGYPFRTDTGPRCANNSVINSTSISYATTSGMYAGTGCTNISFIGNTVLMPGGSASIGGIRYDNAIGANIDCQGRSMIGSNNTGSSGIYIYNCTGTTSIKNCNISNFSVGVYLTTTAAAQIDNMTIVSTINSTTGNGLGISIGASSGQLNLTNSYIQATRTVVSLVDGNNNFKNITGNGTGTDGFGLPTGCGNNTVDDVRAYTNSNNGFYSYSNNNRFYNIYSYGSPTSTYSTYLTGNNNTVINMSVEGNGYGFVINPLTNSTFENITSITNNTAFWFSGASYGNTLTNSRGGNWNTGGLGLRFGAASHDNNVTNFTVTNKTSWALQFGGAAYNNRVDNFSNLGATAPEIGIWFTSATNNTVTNSNIRVNTSTYGAVYNDAVAYNNTVSNSILNGTAQPAIKFTNTASGNQFINNSLYSTGTVVSLTGASSNNTLDCSGKTITGANTTGVFAIVNNMLGTNIKNCNIYNWSTGIVFNSASTGNISNTNISSTVAGMYQDGIGIYLNGSATTTINNVNVSLPTAVAVYTFGASGLIVENSTFTGYQKTIESSSTSNAQYRNVVSTALDQNALRLTSGAGNKFTNVSFKSTGLDTVYISGGNTNVFNLVTINGTMDVISLDTSHANIFANSTIIGRTERPMWIYASENNTFINNTITGANQLIYSLASSKSNVFCLNTFGNATSYVNETAGPNFFNCTYSGLNQGNSWPNVINGSVTITGTVQSSLPGLYIGAFGSGYPYNNLTSSGKLFGNVVDYAPLTSNYGYSCGVLGTANTVYTMPNNVSVGGASCFTVTAPNITLDCAGYSITGNNSTGTYGVYSNQFNTTVKNCKIDSFSIGVGMYSGATYGKIINVTATSYAPQSDGGYPFLLNSGANYGNIINSTALSTQDIAIYVASIGSNVTGSSGTSNAARQGIRIDTAPNTTVTNSNGSSNGNFGIFLTGASEGSQLIGSIGSSNGSWDINVQGSGSNIIDCQGKTQTNLSVDTSGIDVTAPNVTTKNCIIDGGSIGIYYASSTGGLILNNTVRKVDYQGIYISNHAGAQVINNTANSTLYTALHLSAASNTTVQGNTFYSVTPYTWLGVALVASGTNNTLLNNTILSANSFGIRFSGETNSFAINNSIVNDTYESIYVQTNSNGNSFIGNTISGAGANGIYITGGTNTLIDCRGKSMAGKSTAGTYGVYSDQLNTTVKNCNISGFSTGIGFAGANNGTIQNNTIVAAGFPAIYLDTGASYNLIFNNTASAPIAGSARGVSLQSGTHDNVVANNTINGNDSIYGALLVYGGSYNNLIENNTINGYGATRGVTFQFTKNANNTFRLNTIINATNELYLDNAQSTVTICLNNFTATAGYYAQDSNGSNSYNCTYAGKNQGNAWANVLNGSIYVQGGVSSSIPGLYIGTGGAGYPYNSTTSLGKVLGVVDWAPLTSEKTIACGDVLSVSGKTYTMTENISINDTWCLSVAYGAENVTLDCNGYTIKGTYQHDNGIIVNSDNVTVKNCFIDGFWRAIATSTTGTHATFKNITGINQMDATQLEGDYMHLDGITFLEHHTGDGITETGKHGLIENSYLESATFGGHINGENTTVRNITSLYGAQIYLYGIGSVLTGSFINNTQSFAAVMVNGQSETVENNTIITSSGYGAAIEFGTAVQNALIRNNTIIASDAWGTSKGIHLMCSSNNVVCLNNITASGYMIYDEGLDVPNNCLQQLPNETLTCGYDTGSIDLAPNFTEVRCMQNIPNESNGCGDSALGSINLAPNISDFGSYSFNPPDGNNYWVSRGTNTVDKDFNTLDRPLGGTDAYLELVYKLPNTYGGIVWSVKLGDGYHDVGIPIGCFNSDNLTILVHTYDGGSPDFYCKDQSSLAWVNMLGSVGDHNIYEQNISWRMNQFEYNGTSNNPDGTNNWVDGGNKTVDKDDTTSDTAIGGTNAYLFLTYKVPANTTGATWNVVSNGGAAQVSVPTNCIANTTSILLDIGGKPTAWCYDFTTYGFASLDTGGLGTAMFEQNMTWTLADIHESGNNSFNCTYDGKNQGNLYSNVANGSVQVFGNVSSSLPRLFIGTYGLGFPYGNGNSDGKFMCNFAGCADYAPLTNATSPPPITACGQLPYPNMVYNLTNNFAINGSTCLNVTAENITIDCKGYSLIGNNTNNTYGIYTSQYNTTIRNCVIANFSNDIYLEGASYGTVYNNTLLSDSYDLFKAFQANSNTMYFNNFTNTSGKYVYDSGYVAYETCTMPLPDQYATCAIGDGFYGVNGDYAFDFANYSFNAPIGVNQWASGGTETADMDNSTYDVANAGTDAYLELIYDTPLTLQSMKWNVITELGAVSYDIPLKCTGGFSAYNPYAFLLVDQTPANLSLYCYDDNAVWVQIAFINSTRFYEQSVTYTTILSSGFTNSYNATIDRKNQGNIYANVLDTTIAVFGSVNSSIPGLFIGNVGPGDPYNIVTSGGKFSCNDASCQDNAPLTPYDRIYPGCSDLDVAGTTYNMTHNVTTHWSCYIIKADNITLDCKGYTLTGTKFVDVYGITSLANNSTVRNCNVRGFDDGIFFNGTVSGLIENSVAIANGSLGGGTPTRNAGIWIYGGGNNTIRNSTGANYVGVVNSGLGILLQLTSGNILTNTNSTAPQGNGLALANAIGNNVNGGYATTDADCPIWLDASHYNTFANMLTEGPVSGRGLSLIGSNYNNATNMTMTGAQLMVGMSSASGNRIINSTLTTTSYANVVINSGDNNVFIGNIIRTTGGTDAAIDIGAATSGNLFYWNNISTVSSGAYVHDMSGGNFYNSTEGNIWQNVISGSVNILGLNHSVRFSALYVGTNGTGYPYNSTTSEGKFVCSFTGCADHAPLTTKTFTTINVTLSSIVSGVRFPVYIPPAYCVNATNQTSLIGVYNVTILTGVANVVARINQTFPCFNMTLSNTSSCSNGVNLTTSNEVIYSNLTTQTYLWAFANAAACLDIPPRFSVTIEGS